ESRGITGRVFNVRAGRISVAEGWHAGPEVDKGSRWDPAELGAVIPALVEKAAANALTNGRIPGRARWVSRARAGRGGRSASWPPRRPPARPPRCRWWRPHGPPRR